VFKILGSLMPDDFGKLQKSLEMTAAAQAVDMGPSPTGGMAAEMKETMQTMVYSKVIENLSGKQSGGGNDGMDAAFNKLIMLYMLKMLEPHTPPEPRKTVMETVMEMKALNDMDPGTRTKYEELEKKYQDERRLENEKREKFWEEKFSDMKATIEKRERDEELQKIRQDSDQKIKDYTIAAREIMDQKMEQVVQRIRGPGAGGGGHVDKLEAIKQGMQEWSQLQETFMNAAKKYNIAPADAQAALGQAAKKSTAVGEFMDEAERIVGHVERIAEKVSQVSHPGSEVPTPEGRVAEVAERALRPIEFDVSRIQFQPPEIQKKI
jgi:hypothetical protein